MRKIRKPAQFLSQLVLIYNTPFNRLENTRNERTQKHLAAKATRSLIDRTPQVPDPAVLLTKNKLPSDYELLIYWGKRNVLKEKVTEEEKVKVFPKAENKKGILSNYVEQSLLGFGLSGIAIAIRMHLFALGHCSLPSSWQHQTYNSMLEEEQALQATYTTSWRMKPVYLSLYSCLMMNWRLSPKDSRKLSWRNSFKP
ncbi:hypothetical protein STAS_08607 [Striga asiatica]|uniref:Uncharacterized protein n=1 Tax=Striga asiatica TaxID=4170 RepID=A0A5A7PIC8_STRAF|nr:hypothetical protein STAS_08607 [Striga asiatica]